MSTDLRIELITIVDDVDGRVDSQLARVTFLWVFRDSHSWIVWYYALLHDINDFGRNNRHIIISNWRVQQISQIRNQQFHWRILLWFRLKSMRLIVIDKTNERIQTIFYGKFYPFENDLYLVLSLNFKSLRKFNHVPNVQS